MEDIVPVKPAILDDIHLTYFNEYVGNVSEVILFLILFILLVVQYI